MTAYLQEIFSSIQGEGTHVGCRQIFIRFAGCNWSCAYCDTPTNNPANFIIENTPGLRDFVNMPNPAEPEQLATIIKQSFDLPLYHSVSLTGGEPLLHTGFIKELLPRISGTRRGIFLETNGTMPDELSGIINLINIISMDIKLESSTKTATPWKLHSEFLEIAAQKEVYLKLVVSEATTDQEITQAGKLIHTVAPQAALILQPVTPKEGILPPPIDRVLKLQEQALKLVNSVRVIPQTHLMMGQL